MEDVSLDRDFDNPISRFHEFRVGRLKIVCHGVYLSGVRQSSHTDRNHLPGHMRPDDEQTLSTALSPWWLNGMAMCGRLHRFRVRRTSLGANSIGASSIWSASDVAASLLANASSASGASC
jgi:hypothetical protein